METKSPVRSGRCGPSARWACAIFSTIVCGIIGLHLREACVASRVRLLRDDGYASTGLRRFSALARERELPLVLADFALRTSDSIRDISSLTEPTRSRFQTASFTRFWAAFDSTPSARAENFSSTS